MNSPTVIKTSLNRETSIKPQFRPGAELDSFPFRTTEKLRFADTDRNGHISNAVFAVCCQNARMEILHDRNRIPLAVDAQFVIARLELEFRGEMHWPGTVEIGTRFDSIGRSSLVMAQSLFLKDRCVANATSTIVLMDRSTRKATAFPPEMALALRGLAGSPGRGREEEC